MTTAISAPEISKQIDTCLPSAIIVADGNILVVKNERLFDVARYLRDTPGLEFDYLNYVTAVDYYDYFELVYQLTSTKHNHTVIMKTRCYGRDNPSVPSVVSLWRSADFQEKETYDLLGIKFEGHPNLGRIVLWEGFQGHPLRKDYL